MTTLLFLPALLAACGTDTDPGDTADTADTADTGGGDTSDTSDTGGDTSDSSGDTADTGTDTGTDTGSGADEFVEAEIDGTLVTATVQAGYVTRNGSVISFTFLSDGNVYPAFTLVIAQTTVLAIDTDYDCSLTSSMVYTGANAVPYYANYSPATSCAYRLSALGDAVGERVTGTFSATMYDATLTTSIEATDGRFDVVLDNAG